MADKTRSKAKEKSTATPKGDTELALRIVVVRPPRGVRFCLQRGRDEIVSPVDSTGADISFDLTVRMKDAGGERPRFPGAFCARTRGRPLRLRLLGDVGRSARLVLDAPRESALVSNDLAPGARRTPRPGSRLEAAHPRRRGRRRTELRDRPAARQRLARCARVSDYSSVTQPSRRALHVLDVLVERAAGGFVGRALPRRAARLASSASETSRSIVFAVGVDGDAVAVFGPARSGRPRWLRG